MWTQTGGVGCTLDVDEGQVLVREGCSGDEAFILLSGRAEVRIEGRRVAEVEPGELFGEIAAIDGGPRTATIVATAPSRVAVLDRAATRDLLAEPGVGVRVAARLATWLRRAQAEIRPPAALGDLTATELRVAELVAEGLTNRQIGCRLLVSCHTVDAHLRHIYTKLGINRRAELAAHVVRGPHVR